MTWNRALRQLPPTTRGIVEDLLPRAAAARGTVAEPPATSPEYIHALLIDAVARRDMSMDRRCRWVGFAFGVMAARGIVSPGLPFDGSGKPAAGSSAHEAREALSGLLERISAVDPPSGCSISANEVAKIIRATLADESISLEQLSLRLGFAQGALTALGLFSVNGERNTARPVFQAEAARGLASDPMTMAPA
jgi:hypothetical protein